jgi:hypothetical protein
MRAADVLDAEAVRSQLTAAAQDLEEVRSSLQQIQSRNPAFRRELTDVIGDSSALDAVIVRLHGLRESAPEGLTQPENEPLSVTAPVDRWIAECNQRLASLAKPPLSAS